MKDKTTRAELVSLFSLCFFFAFMMCLFAPLEFYLSNKGYFFFSGTEIIPFGVLATLATFVIGSLITFVLHYFFKKAIIPLAGVVFGLVLSLYIQGNYIVVDYGALDGNEINWSDFKTQGIISAALFIVVTGVCVLIACKVNRTKFFKAIQMISICLVLVQCVTIMTLMLQKGGLKKEAKYLATQDEEFNLSPEENILVLVLDTFDSKAFSNIMEQDESGKYKEMLKDFTYYPDTSAAYSATDLAVPNILTGDQYQNEVTYGEFLNRAYANSPFITRLNKEDWFCGVYSECMAPQNENTAKNINNYLKLERTVSSHRRLAEFMYKFVGFRYLPQPLKQYCWFYPEDVKSSLECTVDDTKTLCSDSNFIFYDQIPEIKADSDKKVFHFYHLEGTHPPFTINADFQPSNQELTIEDEGKAMMVLIDSFLAKLKEENVYDNSNIIIMADHGHYDMRYNPLFMVKRENTSSEFTVDNKPLSYFNLQDFFLGLMDGKSNDEIWGNEPKDRLFYFYSWHFALDEDLYCTDLDEYKVTGKADLKGSYKETGTVYKAPEDTLK